MNYNRLDDRFIESDVLRAMMHREMLDRVSQYNEDNFDYVIKVDEQYRSDLAAFRAYGTQELRWVFRVIAGHESEYEALPTGKTFTLPDSTWLRNKIRDYAEKSGAIDG
ncbi:baseplate protein [Tatumella sp. OPLPL6]|uniref:baseplate protein n=1 Tax=Tatumella sp. OPLPL6 TaxID=1928657 RepID=UPI000C182881|nr:baseplate protein [Tatumella sp. OPLPL6]PIJ43299.1 baseplate protein [Tatumella sp. OPLPL6]